jgi:hypothetical protein
MLYANVEPTRWHKFMNTISKMISNRKSNSIMRKIILLFSFALLLGCKSKKNTIAAPPPEPAITKIATTEINQDIKDKAYELGRRVLMTCNSSRFKPFNANEATPSVIKNMTKDRLTKTCLKFRLKYGDFKDLQLIEIYKNKPENLTVFRYKALYEKKIANKELRLTMNEKTQLSSVKSMDWVDSYLKNDTKPKVESPKPQTSK